MQINIRRRHLDMDYIESITSQKPPPILYHYTSQEGLIAIIESRSLRMTHIRFMNDASEFSYAMNLIGLEIQEIERALPEKILQAIPTPKLEGDMQILDFIDPLKQLMPTFMNTPVYVSSFSEMPDDISQWRGYCSKLSGFCIGFDSESLLDLVRKQNLYLAPCIYNQSDQSKLIKRLMIEYLTDIKEIKTTINPEEMKEIMSNMLWEIAVRIWKIAPMIKDISFINEREWRIYSGAIGTAEERTKIRPGNSMLIPYIDMALNAEDIIIPIREIIIGPTPHPLLSEHSLRILGLSNKLKFKIKNSNIPYRAW